MKKFFVILCILIFTAAFVPHAFADEMSGDGSLWDNFGAQSQDVQGKQQFFSDKEFEQALASKKKKKKNKNIPKGEMYRQSNETDGIVGTKVDLPILLIPLDLQAPNGDLIPVGHYQVKGEKVDGKPVLKLFQAHDLVAQIPAVETEDDFGQKELLFVKLISQQNDHYMKLIFGNVDFNAYTLINCAE